MRAVTVFDHHEIPVELRIAMQFLALRELVACKHASCNLISHGVGELLDFLRNRLYALFLMSLDLSDLGLQIAMAL